MLIFEIRYLDGSTRRFNTDLASRSQSPQFVRRFLRGLSINARHSAMPLSPIAEVNFRDHPDDHK